MEDNNQGQQGQQDQQASHSTLADEIENGLVHPAVEYAEIYQARPNKMFTEAERKLVIFLKFKEPFACCHCGRKKKNHWSLRCLFTASDMDKGYAIGQGNGVLLPGSPVCTRHLLLPVKEKFGKEDRHEQSINKVAHKLAHNTKQGAQAKT